MTQSKPSTPFLQMPSFTELQAASKAGKFVFLDQIRSMNRTVVGRVVLNQVETSNFSNLDNLKKKIGL
jgi:hypothetical protein